MRAPLSWIREFVDVPVDAEAIGARMSLRGLALEGIETIGDDTVLDFDVTANRPDCLSIVGLAREIATAYQRDLQLHGDAMAEAMAFTGQDDPGQNPEMKARASARAGSSTRTPDFSISIETPDLCARYVGAIADVKVGPSPPWMQQRLTACGIRPISNIVDITNYVLLELGHPMHAFDHARLAGGAIVVRSAHAGERLVTLDGRERTLDPATLVIADAARAQAIGGVMGGAESEVAAGTTRVVFEAAWFAPAPVRRTSRKLGLRSEASYRFERGADLTAPLPAMQRALQLLEEIGAGQRRGELVDCYPAPYTPRSVAFETSVIARVLGLEISESDAQRILERLGFEVRVLSAGASQASARWQIVPPPWRVDIHRPVDVVEEISRHFGFEHLPSTFPAVEQPPPPSDPRIARDARLRQALVGAGLSEAITFAFIERDAASAFSADEQTLALQNPLSETFAVLRPSLLPGLLDAVGHNRRHGERDVRLFEIGTRFARERESRGLGAIWTGATTPVHWGGKSRDVDFFDLKGLADRSADVLGVTPELTADAKPFLVHGRAASIRLQGEEVGYVGQLHPAIAERRGLPAADPVYVLEIDLDRMVAPDAEALRLVQGLPRYPAVVRDLALLLDDTLSASAVRDTIRAAAPATLVDVHEFDRYQGRGIAPGRVSLALRLTFQARDRTLTDREVAAGMHTILETLQRTLGAEQR